MSTPRLPLQRLPDWQERLAAYVAACREQPFGWGRHDCALFAAGGVKSLTGSHVLAGLVPQWLNRREAVAVLQDLAAPRRGRGSLMAGLHHGVTLALGAPASPLLSTTGDIGAGPRGALLVCNGDTWFGTAAHGLAVLAFDQATHCWKVG